MNLLLDFDTQDWAKVERRVSKWVTMLRRLISDCEVKKTRRGYHIILTVKEGVRLSKVEINSIQSTLGDDPARVRMNEFRIKKGYKSWNRLWQMKFDTTGKVIGREIPAPGETASLKLFLFPSDGVFQ